MDDYEPLLSIAVALALGFVIGLERERSTRPNEPDSRGFGGVRTFPLFALAGAVSMLAGREVGWWLVGVVFIALFTPVVLSYAQDVREGHDRGVTSEAACLLTFLLGALALTEQVFASGTEKLFVVAALGVCIATLLSAKESLHGFARKLSRDDVYATIKFLVVAVIVLPLLPDRALGPYDALNPRHIGWMVVLIAGIGFVGYVLVRVLGAGRQLALVGLVGGLVSSTAVTLSMSALARRERSVAKACAVAVLLASGMMEVRMLVVIGIANRALLPHIALPVGALAITTFAVSAVLYFRDRTEDRAHAESTVKLTNPFELGSAFKFGALFAVLLVASKAAMVHFGTAGMYGSAAIAGSTDVDAISLSAAQLAHEGLAPVVAATTILIAIASNTMVKSGMAIVVGGWHFGRQPLLGLALSLVVGTCAHFLL